MRGTAVGHTVYMYQESQDWDRWSYDMDHFQELGGTAIRSGFVPWEVEPVHLDHVERCMIDCQARGVDVLLTTAQLANNPLQGVEESIEKGSAYVARLAERFAQYARWWQVLNEHDATSWLTVKSLGDVYDGETQTYSIRPGMTVEYLETVRDVIALSRDAIHAANPDCTVGTTTTGTEVDLQTEQYIWRPFYDVVAPAVDWIGVHCYPLKNFRNYEAAPARLRRTSTRYGKPILIPECGFPTNGTQIESVIAEAWAHQFDYFTRCTDVEGVWMYQFRDKADNKDDAESCYGLMRYDGTWKDGWRAVRAMIRSITGDLGPSPA